MMASKGEVDAFDEIDAAGSAEAGAAAAARSVREVDVRRSVAEGVEMLVEVEAWTCDATYSLIE